MKAFWRKRKQEQPTETAPCKDESISWSSDATTAIGQALAQAPIPAILKGKIRKELMAAAEEAAQVAHHSEVTPQDVMQGLLAKIPASVQSQVAAAMASKDPHQIAKLQQQLKNYRPNQK